MSGVAFVADLHVGAGGASRLPAQRAAWLEAVSIANVEAGSLVIAGDVFHRPRPTPDELAAFADGLDELRVPMIALVGNHDVSNASAATALEVLLRGRTGMHAARAPQTFSRSDYTLAVLPWTPLRPSADDLLDVARALYLQCDPALPAVLAVHWAIGGAQLPTGRLVEEVLREVMLPRVDLGDIGFDAVIAGHIHKPQSLTRYADGELTPLEYVGSLAAVDHSEAGDEHGVLVWHPESGELERFECPSGPRFVTVDLEGATDPDWFDGELDGAIVRVRYEATPEEHRRIEASAIVDRLTKAGASGVAISATITREANRRGAELAGDVTPLAALEAWLAEQDIDESTAEAMLDQTAAYLEELLS